ncbi:spindle assembly checkpoint kinase [Marasmius tenuissimus]|uniref:Spindle assembly checkpoint kinase n=1 Tax=Marasmius tenuissimus TaxID=585030 RepID=A0ABR2ZBW8_9AGAR
MSNPVSGQPKASTLFLKSVKTSQSSSSRLQQKLAIKHYKKPSTMTSIDPGQLDIGKYNGGFEADAHDAVSLNGLELTSILPGLFSTSKLAVLQEKFSHVYILALKAKALYKSELLRKGTEKQLCRKIEIQMHRRRPNIQRFGYFHDSKRVFLMLEFAG